MTWRNGDGGGQGLRCRNRPGRLWGMLLPRRQTTDIDPDVEWVQIPRETYLHFASGREWARGASFGTMVTTVLWVIVLLWWAPWS